MRYLFASTVLTAVCCVSAAFAAEPSALRQETVTLEQVQPDQRQLSYPKFDGEPERAATWLNAWIAKKIPSCDKQAKDDGSFVSFSAEALKTSETAAILSVSSEVYCSGNAHSAQEYDHHFLNLAAGKEVDLWEQLSSAGKKNVRLRVAEAGLQIPSDDDCKEAFRPDTLRNVRVKFYYKDDNNISLSPSFPRALLACEDRVELAVPASWLAGLYPPESAAHVIISAIYK